MKYVFYADRGWIRAGRFARVQLLSTALLWAAGSSFAADEPVNEPSNAPVNPSMIPDLPEVPWVWQGPAAPLELIEAPPFGPGDKGSSYIDMGRGGPSRLTDRESALLELSRLAVDASRLAGTLGTQTTETVIVPGADADRLKMEALSRAQTDTPVADSGAPSDRSDWTTPAPPARGVPMTPAELEKLQAANGRSGVVILPPAVLSSPCPNAPRPPAESIGKSAPSDTNDKSATSETDDAKSALSGTDHSGAASSSESNDSNGKSARSETDGASAKSARSASTGEGK